MESVLASMNTHLNPGAAGAFMCAARRYLRSLTLCASVFATATALGQAPAVIIRPAQAMPSQPVAPTPPAGETATGDEFDVPPDLPPSGATANVPVTAAQIPPEEVAALKAQFDGLSKDKQDEMKAYYKDLGIDLDVVFGFASAASEESVRVREALDALRGMDFTLSPQNVLAARAKLGFGQVPQPNPSTARGADIARWVHLQVTAGEWSTFAAFLSALSANAAQQIYSQILQTVNRGTPGLLPEEVLALANGCPEEPKPWQLTALAGMLKNAADRNNPGPMLAQIKTGTRLFSATDAASRRRCVDLLAGAGLVAQAYEYLPSLDDARAAGDGDLILVHGKYRADLAARLGQGPEADADRAGAWDLFCEVSLLPAASKQSRQDAIAQAVGLISHMPRAQVTPWLRSVFADDAVAPAALQTIALSATAVTEGKQKDDEHRAQSILSLKEAVDVLLERPDLDQSVLRVPLRMLTTALVVEMENAIEQKRQAPTAAVSREAQLLLRAIPSTAWFDALEPSLAVRTSKACIGIATIADETDLALSLVSDAVHRAPDLASSIAGFFLKTWQMRLSPKPDVDPDMMLYVFWRNVIPQAPLTRGRQRRNLERLGRLMDTLSASGVDARTLPEIAAAFKACHGITEVYDAADIDRVFGPTDRIPVVTCESLAQAMAASLNGDWRNRTTQVQQGVKRSDTEIAQLVDKGYGVALDLIESALHREPDSWRFAVVKAGLAYDRMQFRMSQKMGGGDSAQDADYRAQAFAAFEQAANRYAVAIANGEEREDAGVYERWFGAAMGTSQLTFLNADDLPPDGSMAHDQVERIKIALAALPTDVAFRHISDFASAINAAVLRSDPEIKPRLVKQALRIVGDHPAGASLRALDELYRDLVKDEIKLRLVIDGDDRVGTNQQFGVLVSLRFTNSVDRETGGFSKYLQTNAFVRVGRQYQEVNFREKLEKDIESALNKGFIVESIGFFDPFMPPRGVVESGHDGWLEKPMAYAVLSRKDPASDHLPQITMDMQFEDQTGPVTLVLPSNTPPIALGGNAADKAEVAVRPCKDLKVTLLVDPRDARDREKDRTIKLDVIFRGKGAVPDIKDALAGIETAIDGYQISDKGIEARPTVVMQEGEVNTSRFGMGMPKPPEEGYPEPDENGIYRLSVERTWTITYVPSIGSLGNEFRLPILKSGVTAKLESRYYSDMDIVPVSNNTVAVDVSNPLWRAATIGGAMLVLGACVLMYRRARARLRKPSADGDFPIPARVTPLNAVMTLRKMLSEHATRFDEQHRIDLERDIVAVELKYFGPGNSPPADELTDLLQRWAHAIRA